MKNIVLTIVCAVILIVVFKVFGSNDEEKKSVTKNKISESTTDGQMNAPNNGQVSAYDMNADYFSNVVRGDVRYKYKSLIVTGQISDIGSDEEGAPYIILDQVVRCSFGKDQASKIAELNNGVTVKVGGKCEGKTAIIEMDNCSLE